MGKRFLVLTAIAVIMLALTACGGDDEWSDVAPRKSATSLAGQVVTFGSTINDHSQVSCQRQGWQLDVVISETRIYNQDKTLNTARPPRVGDKGILTQEDGIWYIDVFPDE